MNIIERRREWLPAIEESKLSDGSVSFFAFHPSIPGVNASGSTEAEAAENWQDALRMYFEHCDLHGLPRPLPTRIYTRVQVTDEEAANLMVPVREPIAA